MPRGHGEITEAFAAMLLSTPEAIYAIIAAITILILLVILAAARAYKFYKYKQCKPVTRTDIHRHATLSTLKRMLARITNKRVITTEEMAELRDFANKQLN